MFTLRYYQEEAVNSVYNYFMVKAGNPIIAMPTGTGKSIVIAELTRRVLHAYPSQQIQMVTHVKTLIKQNFDKLLQQWPSAPAGIYSAGLKRRDTDHPIIFGGIQSMHKRAAEFGHVDLLVVDECHLIPTNSETMYQRYITALLEINPHLKVIGLSATPYRLKGGHLCEGGTFTDVCFDNTQLGAFNKLIDEGYIVPPQPKKMNNEIDSTGLHLRGGEYITAELEERVEGDVSLRALEETVSEGRNRHHWLVYAVSVAHANTITKILNDMGVRTVSYHSKMPAKEADQALIDFADGKYRAIVSRDRLTTGVDLPQVDLIAVLRLTRSPGLWVQMLGRGTRPYPGKTDCLVLDFAGNTQRLGPINDPILPTKINPGDGGGTAPVKACPNCMMFQPAGVRVCEHCGFEFPRFMHFDASASTKELVKRDWEPPRTLHVDHVTYKRHRKNGKPDSLRVSYFVGLIRVEEFVCPDHGGYATLQAHRWWKKRTWMDVPGDLNAYMEYLAHLAVPVRIDVDFNGKLPKLKSVYFQ
jgi:DNA repair protein RadD